MNKPMCQSKMNTTYKKFYHLLALLIITGLLINVTAQTRTVHAAPQLDIWGDMADTVFGKPAATLGDLLSKALGLQKLIEMAEKAIDEAIANAGDEVRKSLTVAGNEVRSTLEKFRSDNESTILLLQ